MQIVSGSENLASIEPRESLLHKREEFSENERASCQTSVMGDVVVTTTYW
jgi:ferredoxin